MRHHPTKLLALPIVADSSSSLTCGGNNDSENSHTMPRSGSEKLWNSSITTAETRSKSSAADGGGDDAVAEAVDAELLARESAA